MKIVIMGGSGFVGSALSAALILRGDTVVVPTRQVRHKSSQILQFVPWDGTSSDILASALQGADAVINLVGENIAARRWNAVQKERILQSRIRATTALIDALKLLPGESRPRTLIQGSAVGYYGAMKGEVEESCCLEHVDRLSKNSAENLLENPAGNFAESQAGTQAGFLAQVAAEWEKSSLEAESLGLRRVLIRTATVLDYRGGALPKLMLPFRLFVGGTMGSGKQYFSWVHIADEVGAILHLLDSDLSGPFNLAAPEPVQMKVLAQTLGQVMKKPAAFKVPGFILKIALGQMGEELILAGQRATPKRLLESGYQFKFPTLKAALTEIIDREKAEQ